MVALFSDSSPVRVPLAVSPSFEFYFDEGVGLVRERLAPPGGSLPGESRDQL